MPRTAKNIAQKRKTKRGPGKGNKLIKMVKKVIHDQVENKQAFHSTGDSLVKFNSVVDSAGDILQIVPSISQGFTENTRTGDQIRSQKFSVKGFVKLDTNVSGTGTSQNFKYSQVMVRLMVLSMKQRSSYADVTGASASLSTLLRKGGVTTGFNGYLRDIYAPINTDVFTVHYDSKFMLSQDAIISPNNTTTPGVSWVTSDISKAIKFFKIDLKCKNRLLKYDPVVGSSTYPTNYAPFLCLGYSYLDGSGPDILDTKVGLQYDAVLEYEDL